MNEWVEVTLGDLAVRVAVKNVAQTVQRVMTVSATQGLIDQNKFFTKSVASENLSTYLILQPGDFVYNKSTSKEAAFGVVARLTADEPVVVTPLYIPFRARPMVIDPNFLLLACNGDRFFGSLAGLLREGARSHGLLNVRLAEFFSAKVALPDLVEQGRIVAIMSAVDAQIEALQTEMDWAAASTKRIRAHLFEASAKRVALGEIADVSLGRMLSKERSEGVDQAPYIRNANVQWHGLDLSDLKTMSFSPGDRQKYRLRAGDILVCEGGDPGRCVLLSADLDGIFFQKAVHRVRSTNVRPAFLYQALVYAYESGATADLTTSTTIQHLTLEKFRTLSIAMVPEAEQDRMARILASCGRNVHALAAELAAIRVVRADLLSALLSQEITADAAVDQFVKVA